MSERLGLAEPALVGREKELEELQACLNSAIGGKGKTVFVSGEAGSGKSRLVREFLGSAREKGAKVLTGWCLSNAAVPYFPFFEAFNAYFTREPNERIEGAIEITGWLKGPSNANEVGKRQEFSPQVWKDQTFAAVAKTLESISTRKPVILFLDDVHWADSASLVLIHYIARAIMSERVLLLATFRSEQLTPDAEGRPHPLVETLRQMRREDLYKEIKVANLSHTSVSELAKSMLGGDLQRDFVEKLAKESQGNALFVVESMRMLHERNGLAVEHDKWRLSSGELAIPEKIKDIILQRLDTLSSAQKETLDAASVIGEEFDVNLLAPVLGQEKLETAKTLDGVAKNTSLVNCKGEIYSFDHARSREAIYDEVSPALKKAYHCKVAETLESASKGGILPLSELAYHYAQTGNKEKAAKYAIAAGQDELVRWSNAQAIEHFTYALQNLPEGQTGQRRIALEGLGDAYAANSMYRDAIKTFDKLAALETGRLRLRAIRKAMDAAYFIWGASDLLIEYAKKAAELDVDDRLEMAKILVNRGRAFGFAASGNSQMDLADSDAALKVFEEEYSLADVATALWRSGVLCAILEGLQEKGIGELLRSVCISKELGDARKEVEATYWTGTAFWRCLLHSEAKNEFSSVLRTGEKLGMFAELSLSCIGLGIIDEYDGKLAEAISDNFKASEYGKKTDAVSGLSPSIGHLIRIYSKLGDLKHADECFEKVSKFVQEASVHYLIAPDIALTNGVRLAAKGQWDESNETFEKLLESLKTIGFSRPFWRAHAGMDYAWALEKQGRFQEAKVHLEEAQRIQRELEARFEHSNLQANLMARRQVLVGEEFEMRLDLVNVSRKPGLLVKAEGVVPFEGFKVTALSPWCSLQNGSIETKKREIGSFKVETVKLTLQAVKAGTFTLNPRAVYIDEMGETKIFSLNQVTITVEPAQPTVHVLPGRISSGFPELDDLLGGGIPENYALILSAPSSDERELLIKLFLEVGSEAVETTFYLTTEAGAAKTLAETYKSEFSVLICNPRADAMIGNLPNVNKLKGVENLTEIDIALAKYFRTLKPGPKRACIQIVSDVLLQHHAITTRKWLSALLLNLKAKGFTTLAIVNPQMHPHEEAEAILSLFDGEIALTEKATDAGVKKVLKVKRLSGQEYLDTELEVTKEKLKAKKP